jgi:DNA-binding CsgD family transcriptional regulator
MNPTPGRKKPLPAAPQRFSAIGPIDLTAAFGLTRRECEVMQWVCEGKRDREIAAILGLSARTVQVHVGHVFEKLNVETRTAAANYCRYSGTHPTDPGSDAHSRPDRATQPLVADVL